MGRVVCLIIIVFFILFVPQNAYAVSVTVSDLPASIGTDPFTFSVHIAGAASGTNYLRVDLYKDETTNYFGETFNGSGWYGGSDGTQYLPIAISGDNTYTVQGRVGDTIPKDYDGTGNYKLRIRRYTAGGNYTNDEAKVSAVSVVLVFPTAVPSPTPTSIPTKTPTPTKEPTPTKISPTVKPATNVVSTQNVTKIPSSFHPSDTPVQTQITSIKKAVLSAKTASADAIPTSILRASISATPTVSQSKKKAVLINGVSQNNTYVGIFVVAGVLFIACGILIYRRKRQNI